MAKQYKVAEFAKLAGVTVRTLQYYDRIGLLSPSDTTEAGYRLYTPADLLPLQQIVTLKWMGFSLKQIRTMLANPRYNLHQTLAAQKSAVDTQIERLQAASAALETALEAATAHDTTHLDAETIQTIIRAVTHAVTKQGGFLDTYYSEANQAGIALRGLSYTPSEMEGFQQQWQSLYDRFETLIDRPLDDPAVMKLAAEMNSLINTFTGGDEETEAGLRQLVDDATAGQLLDAPEAHTHFTTIDNDLQSFMQRALTHYRQSKK